MGEAPRYRFPGMDPWLEERSLWTGIHDTLIIHMAEQIAPQVAPRYVAWPGQRMVLEIPERARKPDVSILEQDPLAARATAGATLAAEPAVTVSFEPLEVNETFVEIRDLRQDKRVVTIIEVLSPSNKRAGADSRKKYLDKQAESLAAGVHFVEIDLLRAGQHTVAVPPESLTGLPRHDYRVALRRAGIENRAEVHPIPLRRRLPRIAIPLVPPDPDAVADLQSLLEHVYTAGFYALGVDYGRAPDPPLSAEDAAWAAEILRASVC